MAPEEELTKQELSGTIHKSDDEENTTPLQVPERFRDGDDADEDCTAPSGVNGYMNQSVFGMIAAAGSQVDFDTRFDVQSSDDEVDDSLRKGVNQQPDNKAQKKSQLGRPKIHKRRFSRTILRSIHGISSNSKSKHASSTGSGDPPSSQLKHLALAPRVSATTHIETSTSTFDVGLEMPSQYSFSKTDNNDTNNVNVNNDGKFSENEDLSKKLMEIFQFESPEKVIEGVALGFKLDLIVDKDRIPLLAHEKRFASRLHNEVVKSGYLSKSGRRNPKFNRYLFRLKGDVLSYYTDPSDLYFPRGNIDLRYGISAKLVNKESSKDAAHFTVVTNQREYNFKADSVPSAKEWVKALQKIIFRSHNEGDSVKISLPIENIIDIEESQMVDFAETCKIRVVDNGDTYAVDEYFFSFFSFGKEALNLLRSMVEDTTAQQIHEELVGSFSYGKTPESPKVSSTHSRKERKPISPISLNIPGSLLEENVRATLTPPGATSPRVSAEMRRKSSDICRKSLEVKNLGRRSLDLNRLSAYSTEKSRMTGSFNDTSKARNSEQKTCKNQISLDPYAESVEGPESLSITPRNSDDTHASGSQILKGSDVFLSPTIQHASSTAVPNNKNKNTTKKSSASNLGSGTEKVHKNPESVAGYCSAHIEPMISSPTLQNFVKVGAYPLQRAASFGEYLNKHSKRMSNLLVTESMGYVEKVSGMWKGGKRHYDEANGIGPDDVYAGGDNEDIVSSGERFREHFALPETEKLQAAYFGFLNRVLPLYGKIYISDRSFCFRSLLPATNTKLILPLKDIENVDKEKGFRFGYSGLVVVIKAHEELFFEFSQSDTRDDCAVTLLQNLETLRYLYQSGAPMTEEMERAKSAAAELKALQQASSKDYDEHDLILAHKKKGFKIDVSPIVFDDPRASILNFKPAEPLCITCLTIGSRGDVQPYIALCKGLVSEGHHTRIATHLEFKDWVEGHGIEFKPVSGDPAELMRICIENGMFTYSFLKEASSKFRGWVDELLVSAWDACQGSDILIESPSAMGGIHIAEALAIPYFRAFTMPWTRTRAYPHAFAVPEHKMGGAYNYMTYVMFDNLFWKAIAGQVNRWRKKHLNLKGTNLEKLQPNKVPFLYNFSPAVVVPPLDYSDWIRVTGYWFLDEGSDWTPPKELIDFIAKARIDKKKLVYVGFGSIVVQDSAALTNTIIKSVEKADVRCILSRGWSDRLDKKDAERIEPRLPESIIQIQSAPHDWLFKQIDAAAHHGGAGTTGASLRAGIPTIIKPFFGDQYFFGSRVEDLGVGIAMKKLNVSVFSRALWQACNDERMIIKAKVLGKTIREENGVNSAIQSIYRDLEYAKSLIKRSGGKAGDELVDDSEESWTFISEENDPALVCRIRDWESMTKTQNLSLNHADGHDSDGSTIRKELEREIIAREVVN
ncbi:Sterol 3-beta-glucosyltransferase [Podosphaera aphanis]|nr:Sterol 3-beta-glucosyltransferase [Podosphaera aphanis]